MSDVTPASATSGGFPSDGLKEPPFSLGVVPRLRIAPATSRVQLSAHGLRKSYRKGPLTIPVLQNIDLAVHDGEFVAVVGKSGSGKSTLLHLLATLDSPDDGEIHFEGQRIDNLSALQRDRWRNGKVGVVFQFYHLLPELTTLENVLLPAMIASSVRVAWLRRGALRQRARELLEVVGLGHRLNHRPRELSGGEMQRAAIARSLMNDPPILLADEPTGNLDRQTGTQVLQLLQSLNRSQKLTIVMVTHDATSAQRADRVVQLVEGRVSQV